MAHFAEIDESGLVLRVLVVRNEREEFGPTFLANQLGLGGTWVQTSYNSRGGKRYTPSGEYVNDSHMRYNYAAPGYVYDSVRDAFIPPKPHPDAVLNEQTCLWELPPEVQIDGIDSSLTE